MQASPQLCLGYPTWVATGFLPRTTHAGFGSPTPLFFQETPERDPGENLDLVLVPGRDKRFRKRIACAACKAEVTSDEARLEMNQKHQHTFFNPQGLVFRVSCFHAAPGTIAIGSPSDDFTWFPGYRWQIALCTHCQNHLGWRFSGKGSFFGLIENRLVALEQEEDD
ncbi:cereblon family protein [Acanthopleuribacter pedis]|uniref:CULT domain-containing protein n=1 Tax=Acanthopleuribacter pedis TaxID=442870 RepID=A0A8J7QJ59_9BACT|nr:cereblon family protein [Acanthopleuribacter pedis]MBO1319163.1 hypothetical protein [Acanthopleuribacter pedis]